MTFALANKYASQKMILFLFAVSSVWDMQSLIGSIWVKGGNGEEKIPWSLENPTTAELLRSLLYGFKCVMHHS